MTNNEEDCMSYTKYTWQNDETITAEKLNHMEDGIAGAYSSSGGEGSGYDIIIKCNYISTTESNIPGEYYTILKGNILDCEDKLERGEPVTGLMMIYKPDTSISGQHLNASSINLELVLFDAAYSFMDFGGVRNYYNNGSTHTITIHSAGVQYDYHTGSIENGRYYQRNVNTTN